MGRRYASAREFVVDTLREMITSGELEAGARLLASELAEELGVSVTPIREALGVLEADGLVVVEPQKHTRVAPFSAEDIRGTYLVRAALEGLAAKMAAQNATSEEIQSLQQSINSSWQAVEQGEELELIRLNREFHLGIAHCAAVTKLFDIVHQLWDNTTRYRRAFIADRPDRVREALNEHQQILDCLKAGDGEKAQSLLEGHVLRTAEKLVTQVEKFSLT